MISMINLKRVIIIVFLLLIGFASKSQSLGYMGRKFDVSIGLRGMPYTGKMFFNDNAMDWNLRFSTRLEYVLFKNFSIGFNYERVSDKIDFQTWSLSSELPLTYYQSSSQPEHLERITTNAFFRGNEYGYFMKFYFRKNFLSLAPLGKYFKFGYNWSTIDIVDDGRYFNDENYTNLKTIRSRTWYFGWGSQNIYYKYLTVDLFMGLGFNNEDAKRHNDFYYLMDVDDKLFADNIFIIKLNVGWLLF